MKNIVKIFSVLFLLTLCESLYALHLDVVYPKEGDRISAASSDSTFIFGQVLPPDSRLTINGQPISVHANGAFLAFLPVDYGDFTFKCTAFNNSDSVTQNRTITISGPVEPCPIDSLMIKMDSIKPSGNIRLCQGDEFYVSFWGTPNCDASFTIEGVRNDIPMQETLYTPLYLGEIVFGEAYTKNCEKLPGYYTGCYKIQPMDWRQDRKIIFKLKGADNDSVEALAPGTLTIFDNSIPQCVETKRDVTVLRTGAGDAYYYFVPKGVKLPVTGQKDGYYRVALCETIDAWVRQWEVNLLPLGTHQQPSVIKAVRTFDKENKVNIRIFTRSRVPYRIEQQTNPQALDLYLYGLISDTDFIRYSEKFLPVADMRWIQVANGVYKLHIPLQQKTQWGYNIYYDEQDYLNLDIKKSPKIAGWPSSPLKDINILLDPGHEPDLGAVGPTRLEERHANIKLAEQLSKKLEGKGAHVYLTRKEGEGITLRTRMKYAAILDADILLSLHHNAIPDGINPFKSHGTSTYYYHPQSYQLAKIIKDKLLAKLGLNDFGLFYDDLAMCRIHQMPSVLVEPAFIMYPEEEALIRSKKYKEQCADAIVEALEEFLKKVKE